MNSVMRHAEARLMRIVKLFHQYGFHITNSQKAQFRKDISELAYLKVLDTVEEKNSKTS